MKKSTAIFMGIILIAVINVNVFAANGDNYANDIFGGNVSTTASEAKETTTAKQADVNGTSTVNTVSNNTSSNSVSASPKKAKIKKLKNVKGNKVTVKLKKIKNANGYQIKYSTDKKFRKSKTVTSLKLTYTIKKLKAKKTYYVKARAYKNKGNRKKYGVWSTVKKVKIRK